jgi:hypothetical protein
MSATTAPARLVLQQPSGEALVFAVDQGRSVTIGRDVTNTIVLNSPFVSKRHALVSWSTRGVRIEDQDSANGISVNGLVVHAAQLSGGDVIQIGDQTLVFEAEGQAAVSAPIPGQVAAPPPNKALRLVLVAVLTMLLLVIMLGAVYLLLLAPVAEETLTTARRTRTTASLPADTPITPFDSPQAKALETQALAAKGRPVDWIYDEGLLAVRTGRLLDAYRLFHGVLHRDPTHEGARRELLRVMAERDLRLTSFQAAADRAEKELKFDEAARQWEQVLAMTLDNEALHARARTEATRLQARASAR